MGEKCRWQAEATQNNGTKRQRHTMTGSAGHSFTQDRAGILPTGKMKTRRVRAASSAGA